MVHPALRLQGPAPAGLASGTVGPVSFVIGAILVVLAEALAVGFGLDMWGLAGLRAFQAGVLLAVAHLFGPGLGALGFSVPGLWRGVRLGILWSLGFGLVAAAGLVALTLVGVDALGMLGFGSGQRYDMAFLVAGGLVGPIAEELFFRGFVYGFLRRWGVILALAGSTALFVAAHTTYGVPLTQAVGGILFALCYEHTRTLAAPILVHILGNLALFAVAMA